MYRSKVNDTAILSLPKLNFAIVHSTILFILIEGQRRRADLRDELRPLKQLTIMIET